MLKILGEQWGKNSIKLKNYIREHLKDFGGWNLKELDTMEYIDLVKLTFDIILKDSNVELDLTKITQIDNGDYQGTLLFIIPFDTYQPSEDEYLMTYIDYGSCPVCDIFMNIQDNVDSYYDSDDKTEEWLEKIVNSIWYLCKDIVVRTIKPYPSWSDESKGLIQMEWEDE